MPSTETDAVPVMNARSEPSQSSSFKSLPQAGQTVNPRADQDLRFDVLLPTAENPYLPGGNTRSARNEGVGFRETSNRPILRTYEQGAVDVSPVVRRLSQALGRDTRVYDGSRETGAQSAAAQTMQNTAAQTAQDAVPQRVRETVSPGRDNQAHPGNTGRSSAGAEEPGCGG